MKVNLSVELDLDKVPGYDLGSVNDLSAVLQNLSGWLAELHTNYLEKLINARAHPNENPDFQRFIVENCKANLNLSKQLFNNYRVTGTTNDGHSFEFIHTEPYEETMTIDGQPVRDF